jgi:TonB family protein
MVCRRTAGSTLLLLSSLAGHSHAQSLSLEEEKPAPAPAPTPAPTPKAPAPPPVIVMPAAVSTPLEYPADAQGEASVALELTLSAAGDVTKALVLEGDEPFAGSALAAAKAWKFQPATRDGQPIAAKIRYLVRFVPPRDVAEPEPEPAPTATETSPGKKPGLVKPAEPAPYEIIVVGERAPIRHELARTEISRIPGAFGDAFRAIEALPGVVPIVSGLPYFYVRGAPPGNVGYFVDGIPVPFLYHFAAGPSLFHPAFIERVDLYPGAYPVRYGRFAGAIVAGEMAPPGYRWRGEWNVRLIDSGAMVEAPFADGRGSVMVGGRYSYTGLVISLIAPDVSVGYWDYQARARYDLSPKDSVEVFGFGSGDYSTFTDESTVIDEAGRLKTERRKMTLVDVGFHRLDLRWDHRLEQGNWRNALMVGRDRTGFADGQINVYDYMVGLRSEYWRQLDKQVRLRAGADLLFESLKQEFKDESRSGDEFPVNNEPGALPPGGTLPDPPAMMPPIGQPEMMFPDDSGNGNDPQQDAERLGFNSSRKDFSLGLYADLVWDVAPKLQITPGLRADLFVSGSRAAVGVDPRITAEYTLSKKLKVVHGLALVHQAPSFIGPVPGFKPSLAGGLQKALQHSAGVNYELPAGFSGSLALFQSAFFNMTDLISLLQLEQTASRNDGNDGNDNQFNNFRTDGHAYGLELMVRRSLSRKLGGFVSYTLSRSRRFARRVSGPATTDRTHVLNVAASYDLGKNWRLGGRVLFYTGIPAEVAYIEAARHPPRTPAFWRLDFKLEKRWYIERPNRWWGLNIEVLNTTLNTEKLTGSCNAFSCTYEEIGPVTVPSIAFEGAF